MHRGKLLMITLAVMLAGIVAALPYQRAPQSGSDEETNHNDNSAISLRGTGEVRQGDLMTLSLSPTDEYETATARSPAAEFLQSAKDREPVLELPQIRRDEALRNQAIVPELAPSFRPFTETIRLLRDVDSNHRSAAPNAVVKDTLAQNPTPVRVQPLNLTPPPSDFVVEPTTERPTRYHRVVDGDTLQSIAQRYYSDATLSDFLFQANRQVLTQPQVLPLGAKLEIPIQKGENLPPQGVLGKPQNVSTAARNNPPVDSLPLVPIP
jgi:LysM repeat protein